MERLMPVDTKEEFCRVEIKEEVCFEQVEEEQESYVGGVKDECAEINEIKEETCFDVTEDQSFTCDISREENLSPGEIKTEGLNNTDLKNDDFIKDEEEIDYVWPEDAVNETDPLALPEFEFQSVKEEVTVTSDSLPESSSGNGIVTQTIPTIPVNHVTSNQMVNLALSNGQVITTTLANLQTLAQPHHLLAPTPSSGIVTQTILTIPVNHVASNQMVNLALSNGQVITTTLANLQKLALPHHLLAPTPSSELSNFKAHDPREKKYDEKRQLKCEECGLPCSTLYNLQRHMSVHTGVYKCTVCVYTTTDLHDFKTHKKTHAGKKHFKCKVCDYASYHVGNLKTHIKTHTGQKDYKCKVCEYTCSNSGNLIRHMRKHTKERPYKCDACDYAAAELGNLKSHVITQHNGEKEKNHKCSECEYTTFNSSHLKRHMRKHTGERPYKCSVCDYASSEPYNVKIHEKIHTGEKNFKCNVCAYSSFDSGSLKRHMRRHTKEQCKKSITYKCNTCDIVFPELNDLRAHIKTHPFYFPYPIGY